MSGPETVTDTPLSRAARRLVGLVAVSLDRLDRRSRPIFVAVLADQAAKAARRVAEEEGEIL